MADTVAAELAERASAELIDALRDAVKGATRVGREVSLFDVVDRCLEDPGVVQALPRETLVRLRAHLFESHDAWRRSGPSPLRQSAAALLASVVSACSQLITRIGTGRVSPLGLIVGILLAESAEDPSELAEIRRALLRAGLGAASLIRLLATGNAGSPSWVYEPLGFGVNISAAMSAERQRGCPLVGMERVVERVVRRLSYHSVCLIGEPGVGKSEVVRGIAWHLANRSSFVRKKMHDWTIVSVSRSDLLAGTGVQGRLEERIRDLLSHLREVTTVIPFFDEVHTVLSARDEIGTKVANILKPAMAEGRFRCIAATTDREYERYILPDEPLHSRFAPTIIVGEPDDVTAVVRGVVDRVKPEDADGLGVVLGDDAIPRIVRVTDIYQRNDRQPRKAIRLLAEVFEQKCHRRELRGQAEPAEIDRAFVDEVAGENYGLPVEQDRPEFWSELASRLGGGSPEGRGALLPLAALLFRRISGLGRRSEDRTPRARVLLLCRDARDAERLASALCSALHGPSGTVLVEDMRRMSDPNSKSFLAGAPPGYVGHDEARTLFARVRVRPQGGVLLLRDLGYAHPTLEPEVLSILDGSAKDASSNPLDFSQWTVLLSDSRSPTPPSSGDPIAPGRLRRGTGDVWTDAMLGRIDLAIELEAIPRGAADESVAGFLDARRADGVGYPPELDDDGVRSALAAEARSSGLSAERAVESWLQAYAERLLQDGTAKEVGTRCR